MSIKKKNYENLAGSLIKKFNQRGVQGYYCDDKEEALAMAKRFLTPGCSIAWGGSETLREIGLLEELSHSDYELYDRHLAKTQEEKDEVYAKSVTADFYFMSSNAISLDGQLINIDGIGNRVACLIYGPKNVIVIAGMNKIVTDVQAGVARIRNFASPPNALRLNRNTPCADMGKCGDCYREDCICCQIVVTRMSKIPNRIKVILVGEELGY